MSDGDFEAIWERIHIWGDGVCGEHTPLYLDRRIIVETLLRVPESVREKVVKETNFITIGGAYGCPLPMTFGEFKSKEQLNSKADGPVWVEIEVVFILLNFAEMEKDKMDEEDMRTTVAHEIAHFILGHHKDNGSIGSLEGEKEADDLIVTWGFKRAYQSYERFAKRRTL